VAHVLVAYATCHGSTEGIAARIGHRLQAGGLEVDVRAVGEVDALDGYDAVVLGSAVHDMKWLPEARDFAQRHAIGLRQRATWLFTVSSVGDQESFLAPSVARVMRAMRKPPPEVAALRSAVRPRDHRNFAGAIARSDWSAAGDAFLRIMGGRYGDHRSWTAIDEWATSIAAQLTTDPSLPHPG